MTKEERAVFLGYWMVSLPVWLVMMAFFWMPILVLGLDVFDSSSGLKVMGAAFGLGLLFAWLVWSVAIPRWRLWAYRRVDDIEQLKALGVKDKLIYSDGHWATRTEIAPRWLRAELEEIERQKAKSVVA